MNKTRTNLENVTHIVKGVIYDAKDVAPNAACLGCAFIEDTTACGTSPYCSGSFRADKRDVIWIKKEEKE